MKKDKANISYLDPPHHEGAPNTTAPEGQPGAHTVTQSHSEMIRNSEKQVRGRMDLPGRECHTSNQHEERLHDDTDDTVL